MAHLRILENPNLGMTGTKAEQLPVCAMGKLLVSNHSSSPHLCPGRGLVLPAQNCEAIWSCLCISVSLQDSTTTQGFNFSDQPNPALAQSHPEGFPGSPDPGKEQMGCRFDVVALPEPSPIPAAPFCPLLPSQPPALALSGFHSCHSSKSKMGLN